MRITFYSTDNPEKLIHFNVGYVNESAIRAELFRTMHGIKTTDSLLALRLNTSHILHTRLHWRPAMVQDMKVKRHNFSLYKTIFFAFTLKNVYAVITIYE